MANKFAQSASIIVIGLLALGTLILVGYLETIDRATPGEILFGFGVLVGAVAGVAAQETPPRA